MVVTADYHKIVGTVVAVVVDLIVLVLFYPNQLVVLVVGIVYFDNQFVVVVVVGFIVVGIDY